MGLDFDSFAPKGGSTYIQQAQQIVNMAQSEMSWSGWKAFESNQNRHAVVTALQDNASDKFLEVVIPTDVQALLRHIPLCRAIVTTGQKATETICTTFRTPTPAIGNYSLLQTDGREIRLYRMPSTSRAYPMKLEKKAKYYQRMLNELDML